MSDEGAIFHHCLYFTANALCRTITRMAEETFAATGLSPSYAFLMMLVHERPGIVQKELAEALHLAPSTVTRFINKLERQGYLERQVEGRTAKIYPTEAGQQLKAKIDAAWKELYEAYTGVLGEAYSKQLTQMIDEASQQLEEEV